MTLELLWAEEFEGSAGAPPDLNSWGFMIGDGSTLGIPGWGNEERQFYIPEAVSLTGRSELAISATRMPVSAVGEPTNSNPYFCYYGTAAEWTSARISTLGKIGFKYGRIEARMQMPVGAGTWPAFWMLGSDIADNHWPNCGEIDIAEGRGDFPCRLFGTVHGPGYFADNGRGAVLDADFQLGEGFHTYAIDWLPEAITWYVDEQQYSHVSKSDVPEGKWVFDHEFHLLLNLAMGGNFAGAIDPQLESATFTIDYVRHFAIDGVGENFKRW